MDVNSKQIVECTQFASAFDTKTPVVTTLSGYFGEVKNGKHKQMIDLLRAYRSAGESEKASTMKKRLPLLVAGGVMEGGRRVDNLVRYSGCVTVDLDDVPGSPREILRQAEQLDYVKAGHISPSGTGNKLFVLVGSDLAHHTQAFLLVSRMIERDLPGVKVDASGKDPNRGCFAGYDEEAFYKEVSRVVEVPVCDEPPAGHEGGGHTLTNYIDKFEAGNSFADGGRHTYLVKLASALNAAGFGEAEVTAECLLRYTAPDFGTKEIGTTISDVYRRYRTAFGSRKKGDPAKSKTGASLQSLQSLPPHF